MEEDNLDAKSSKLDSDPVEETLTLLSDPVYWQEVLEDDLFFKGNVESASMLAAGFVEGMNETYKIKRDQNMIPGGFSVPSVITGNDTDQAGAHIERGVVRLPGKLNEHSARSPGEIVTETDEDGNVVFEGKLEDWYVLAGAEEMNHVIDLQSSNKPGRKKYVPNVERTTTSDYDSSDLEFRSLGTRLLIAKKRGMSPETVRGLERRVKNAADLRHKS